MQISSECRMVHFLSLWLDILMLHKNVLAAEHIAKILFIYVILYLQWKFALNLLPSWHQQLTTS